MTEAVRDWLAYGLTDRSAATIANYSTIAETRIVAPIGARKLRDLSAEDVDRWLRAQAREVSTRTLRLMHSILNRAVTRAMARDKVKRNVVILCTVPTGQAGRPSKSLALAQAEQLLTAHPYTPTSCCHCSPALAPRKSEHCAGPTSTSPADPTPSR